MSAMSGNRFGNEPTFVVSTGRAGSQMLARILALHPEACALHEPLPHLHVEAYAAWSGSRARERIRARIRVKREDLIRQVQANGLAYIESSHYASHLVGELHALFRARFVHLHRDGRDFVRSGLQRAWYGPRTVSEAAITWLRRSLLRDLGNVADDHRLRPPRRLKTRFEQIAWLWSAINEEVLRAGEALPEGVLVTFPVESLEEGTLTRLLDFVGLSRDPDLTRSMLELAKTRPNRSARLDAPPHEAWSDVQRCQFREIAGATMVRLGYWMEDQSLSDSPTSATSSL